MRSSDVRNRFLEFFREKGHPIVPSSSVVPHGDRTLLFTNAGMVQFKDIFTGRRERPDPPRAATVQKCIRAGGKHNDLDNVGYTTRHLTFFEMLGNFSFGDYFKEEAILWGWELVTKRFALDPARLWITVFREDDEARRLWKKIAGIPDSRIVGLGEKDNFWSMGEVGPCGPCSEILVDRGDRYGEADVENGERFFEIWNLVFMQYEQTADGRREPLPKPSIDTGMGLERMAMVLQDVDTVFDTDVLRALIRRIEELSGTPYDAGPKGVPHRVIADHVRSLAFALADGAEISNEGRGYVIRRILRRAARYGRKIHDAGTIVHRLVDTLIEEMGSAYPELRASRDFIEGQIRAEEERFGETLDRGIELFEELASDLARRGEKVVPGKDVFKLYDTFGFPVDLVERMAQETGLTVDLEGFEREMAEQKRRSRGASTFAASETRDEEWLGLLHETPKTRFVGYDRDTADTGLLLAAERDGTWRVVLEETPFYAESGGQIGDTGILESDGIRFRVLDTRKEDDRFVHLCELETGDPRALRSGAAVRAAIDVERRRAIERNHSATHLLHAALREVVGTHVHQKGSLVAPDRLRFDVTHFEAIRQEDLDSAARIVRDHIIADMPVETLEMARDEAIAAGALAFFGEKYGDRVRVVRMGDFSMELCGGTHVGRTGEIGPFLISHEGSVSSGVRRLEALTAEAAESWHKRHETLVGELSRLLKASPDTLVERVEKLLLENAALRGKLRKQSTSTSAAQVRRIDVDGVRLIVGLYENTPAKELRTAYDALKNESERLVALLLGREEGKIGILVTVSKALEGESWDARELFSSVADVLGARGGGRSSMVQAGGSRPEAAEDALARFEARVREAAKRTAARDG